ncbi:MAG: PilZ domain-containing protein [Syntrophobacteraceae bacterium]
MPWFWNALGQGGSWAMHREVRQHVRYKMKDGMLAVLHLPGTLKTIVGQILDISEGGLALRHKDQIAMSLTRAELILMGHEQSEDPTFDIHARLVYEQEQGENYRSGFQFGDLSPGQMSQLRFFIQSNIEPIAV